MGEADFFTILMLLKFPVLLCICHQFIPVLNLIQKA
jgi:hypothetical protein